MSKHPTPWLLDSMWYLTDANDDVFARLDTGDPETRAVLLHAAEMFDILKSIVDSDKQGAFNYVRHEEAAIAGLDRGERLLDEIEAKIAKGKP